MLFHRLLLRKTCLLLLAINASAPVVYGLGFVWTGEVDNKWHTINNWAPGEFGPPRNLDTATISNGRTVLIDANFLPADYINGLTISAGELRSNGFEAIVDNGDVGSTALTQVSGSNARLRIDLNSSGAGTDSFDTDRLSVANGGQVNLYGGRLEVDSGLLNVGSTGRVQGYGNIDLEYVVSTETVVFRNDGLLRVGVVDIGVLMPRTMAINVTDADGRIDLDGLLDGGKVALGLQATLDVNGRLWDGFSSEMTFAPDSRLEMSQPWKAYDFSTIEVNAEASSRSIASQAIISGGTMTHDGLINVNSGTLFVDSDFEGYLGTIQVGGQGKAATICFRGHAVVGAVHLNGTEAAPAKICGDNIEFRPDSFTLVTGYAVGLSDTLPWHNNFDAGSKIQIDGSSSPSKFEIDGDAMIAGDMQFVGDATFSANKVDISGPLTVNSSQATIAGNVLLNNAAINVAAGSELRFTGPNEWRNMTVNVAGDIRTDGPTTLSGATNLKVAQMRITDDIIINGDQKIGSNHIELLDEVDVMIAENSSLTLEAEDINGNNNIDGDILLSNQSALTLQMSTGPLVLGGDIRHGSNWNTSLALIKTGGDDARTTGRVEGNGKYNLSGSMEAERGRWINDGQVAPGFSAGVIEVEGDYEQTAEGSYEAEIGGFQARKDHDQLAITGQAILAGELDISLINNFTPSLGNAFAILTAEGGVNGVFSSVLFPDLGPSLRWDLVYSPKDVTLRVVPDLAGDFDLDGDVDGKDFLIFQRGGSQDPFSSTDLADWQANYGANGSLATSQAVPEPSLLYLGGLAYLGLMGIRRKSSTRLC